MFVLLIAIAAACGGNGDGTPGPGETPDVGDGTPDDQTPTLSGDPEELLEQLWNAINEGDTAAAAELFAEDAIFEDYNHGPPDAFSGQDAVLDFLQGRMVSLNLSVTAIDLEASDGTATGRIERSSPALTRITGFERLIELITVEARDSGISLLRLLPDLADAETAEWQALLESEGLAEPPFLPRSTSPGALILTLDSTGGAGQPGEALLRAFTISDGPSRTEIFIDIEPGPEGEFQPVHIHEGSCDDLGAIVYPLGSLISGRSSTTSVTILNDLLDGDFAIAVHESADSLDNIVACGDIALSQPAE